jgi:predicted CXXCH cytochrome family protein
MIATLLLAGLATTAADGAGLCALCHPDVRVQFERSIHGSESVACTSCHGGDAKASTVAAAHGGRFRGKIRRRDIPALCASCHSDAARMSPYNLATDQYALYQTSHHGRGLAKGDEKVAVCTDCHGVHEILPRDDTKSSVFAANIPATCARCHSDASVMRGYNLSGDPYADFSAGRHGQALLERRDASAPGCSRCHGAHGATPPGVGDVNKVCGQCHATARSYFLQGPHRLAMDKAGLPECASCHGHHKVVRASVETIQTVCTKCHDAASQPVALAIRMKTLYAAASADLESARRLVAEAKAIPIYVADFEARLEEGHTSLVESLPAMHAVELPAVEQLTSRAQSIGREVESEVRSKLEGRRWRGVGLLVFWFYLIVTLGTLVHFRRRAARAARP